MKKKWIALLLAAVMGTLSLPGCAGQGKEEGDVIEVWSFTNELEQMLDLYKATHPDVKVKFTLVPTDVYASKLKNAIQSGNAPDVFAIEEAFVRSFVEEPGVMADLEDLKPDLEEMEILDYTLDVGTDFDGNLRAVSWQAAPGAMFYRRSLAKEYLGTDDPQKVQEYFQDMGKFMETAEIIKEKSQGNCYTVCSPDDLSYIFMSKRETGWVQNEQVVVDDKILEFADFYKTMNDKGYAAQQAPWSEGWFAGMSGQLKDVKGNPKEIFCYFFPAWGLFNTLMPNAASADGVQDTSGDWGVIQGPSSYYWGGTWLGVNEDSDNKEAAKEMVRYFTTDGEFLKQWIEETNDYVASQKVMDSVTSGVSNDFLGGQNPYEVFLADAKSINGKLITSYDQEMNKIFGNEKENYREGKLTIDEMKENIIKKAKRMFPDLK
ncbi:ABC transporter substrate-binding protein [Blautia sp.]|uniref:ABC transporter substrate-binding protein n=2 Tax=Blautia sp. TaxID=1955243 RepID=UPI002604FB06|nr:ABC transporter substrate-binding protein [Blautia sp.]